MNKINLRDVPEEEQQSPSKKFHSFCRNVSLALGGVRNTGLWGGGHPFDFQVRRIPAGAAICPLHSHLAQWELFVVHRGNGTVRTGDGMHPIREGDCFVHPPGEPHQLINSGASDLEVFIVADNPPLDAFFYPDSNKWGLRPPGKFFRATECDYFDGEDVVTATPTGSKFLPVPPLAPFSDRKRNLADIPWEPWSSPKGKFRASGKEISIALGAKPKTPVGLGGHPFDLEYGRVMPGDTPCPFHTHAAQWEFYVFVAGRGTFRRNDETIEIGAGDVVLAAPGVAHTFTNTGDTELCYFLVADDPLVDIWQYPDSKKWGFNAPRKFFRPVEVDYHDGEE